MTGVSESRGALGSLRVLDLSESIAGQYCSRLLADFGAETLLVEPPGGSVTRRIGPFGKSDGKSLLFFHLNLGKGSVTLDRDSAEGRARLLDLGMAVDILLVPAGFDRREIEERNPKAVICTISDFGEDGPRRDWCGGELVMQALSGVMYRNGAADREPLYGCGWRVHYVAGVAAYISVLSAIYARVRLGRGQHCSVDVAETAASMTYALGTQYMYNGTIERRSMPANLPSAVVRCRDGWVAIFIYAYRWREACAALEVPELADDPRYATAEARMANWAEFVDTVRLKVDGLEADELVRRLQALGSVAGRAYRPSELIHSDHLAARSYWETVDTPEGPRVVLGAPFRLEKTPRRLRGAAPAMEGASARGSARLPA